MVYWGKKKTSIDGEITDIEGLKTRVEANSNDITEIKADITDIKEQIKTVSNYKGQLGNEINDIQGELSLIKTKFNYIDCKKEITSVMNELESQTQSNARAIKVLSDSVSGNGKYGVYTTTKEITINLTGQNLVGSFYWYEFEYDITNWDNNEWNLEGIIFKNLHQHTKSGEVEPKTRKSLVTITYDENNLYGCIQTPNMLGNNEYQLEVTCLWSKVLR